GYVDDEAAFDLVESLGVVVLTVAGDVLAAVVAAGLMVLRHYDFTLSRVGADLRIDRGLLERRRSVIPLRRVQSVQLSANMLRRWAGLATIDVQLASSVDHEGTGSVDNTVPVGTLDRLEPLVAVFAGVDQLPAATTRHPTAARRRAITRRALVLVLPWALIAWPYPLAALAGALAGAAASGFGGHRWWMHLRHGGDDVVLVAESGWFVVRRTVQPWAKVQSVSLRRSPGQRRAGLCHLDLHVAASRATTRLRDVGMDQAAALLASAPQPTMPNVLATEAVSIAG
ncbi:MAG: PH domain-containing protein, partial [Actinomycetota bacterium]|nr:PH domain-containing protein [Actinomycetota bacterium]